MANAKSNGASQPQGQGPQVEDAPAAKPAIAGAPTGTSAAMPASSVPSAPSAKSAISATPTGQASSAPAPKRPEPSASPAGEAAAKESAAEATARASAAGAPLPKSASAGDAPAPKSAPASERAKAATSAKVTKPAKPASVSKPAVSAARTTPAKTASGAGKVAAVPVKPVGKTPSATSRPAAKAAPVASSSVVRTARAVAHTVAEALDRGAEAARRVEAAVGERQAASGVEALTRVGLTQVRDGYAVVRQSLEQLQGGLAESAGIASKGAVEINGKVLDLMRAQADAAFGLWRQMLGAGSFSEAVQLQTKGWRQGYEMTSSRLKDIAETTGRIAETSISPVRRIVDTWSKETRLKRGG